MTSATPKLFVVIGRTDPKPYIIAATFSEEDAHQHESLHDGDTFHVYEVRDGAATGIIDDKEERKAMSYNYLELRPTIFTEEGQRRFLIIRDRAKILLKEAGAFTMARVCDCSWEEMACVDRLVELEEIREHSLPSWRGQDRLFTRKHVA